MRQVLGGLLIAVAAPLALAAQSPAVVRGRVVDAASGSPIAAARVQLGGETVLTAGDGRFEFNVVSVGLAVLMTTAVGFGPVRQQFDLLPGAEVERLVRLVSIALELPAINVSAVPGQPAMLDHESLVRRGSDLATALDGWQGVVVRRSGGNGPASPQVRGSAPEEVIVLVDGFSINDPLTGRADLSRVATRDVASVRVRPGAQSAGGAGVAIGGVIDIRSQVSAEAEASGWVGSHGSGGAAISGSLVDARLFVRGEKLTNQFLYRVPPNRGGGEARRLNAGGMIGSLSFRTAGRVGIQGRASISHRGLPGAVGNETPYASAKDGAAFLGATIEGRSSWSGSVQYLRSEVQDSAPPTGTAYNVSSSGVSGTLDWSRHQPVLLIGWRGDLEVGAAARHDQFSGDVVRAESRFSRGGARAAATFRPSDESPWTVAPSARLDLWTGESQPLGSARLDLGWQRVGTALHASVGSAVSAPPMADLFFREGVGVALNPELRPERVRWEVELGVTQDWSLLGHPATASIRGYYGLVDDMILWAPGVGFIWSPRNYDVIRRGVEASFSAHPVTSVSLALQGAYTPITYDVPGGAQVQYRPRGTWGASAGWTGGVWAADTRWRWVGERFPNPGGVNPRPAFGVMDIGVERSIGAAVVRADVRDIFDTRAEFLAGYPTPGRTAVLSISLEWQ